MRERKIHCGSVKTTAGTKNHTAGSVKTTAGTKNNNAGSVRTNAGTKNTVRGASEQLRERKIQCGELPNNCRTLGSALQTPSSELSDNQTRRLARQIHPLKEDNPQPVSAHAFN